MKSFLFLLFTLLTSCSSIELVEMWKNPKIDSLSVSKVLIVGMTSNMEARKQFEEKLKKLNLFEKLTTEGECEKT